MFHLVVSTTSVSIPSKIKWDKSLGMYVTRSQRSLKMSNARIVGLKVSVLSFPLNPPFVAAIREFASLDLIFVEVAVSGGLVGTAYAFAFDQPDAKIIADLVALLGKELKNEDAMATERIWQQMHQRLKFLGPSGAGLAALSVIDMALWDLKGRVANLPIFRMLGAARDQITAYASSGSISLTVADLVDEMQGFADQGYSAVKMKLGTGLEQDVARVRAVRHAVGEKIRIVLDANQQWSRKDALTAANKFSQYDIWWLEEPVAADAEKDCAWVTAASPIQIATGETNFGVGSMVRLLDHDAADILMPNLQRVGGITAWQKIAGMAELNHRPVASHVFPEFNIHLMCGAANGLIFEYVPWWPSPYLDPPVPVKGVAHPPERPGHGCEPDFERTKAHLTWGVEI